MRNSFKELTLNELFNKKEELEKEYLDIRFKSKIGHVDNPLRKRVLRRWLARLNTLIDNHPDLIQNSNEEEQE